MPFPSDDSEGNPAIRSRAAIPEVWVDLVRSRDFTLSDLIASAVEARVGTRPDASAVGDFLAGLANPSFLAIARTSDTHPGIRGPSIYPPPPGKGT